MESDDSKWFVNYNQAIDPAECAAITLGLAMPGSGTGIWNEIASLIPSEVIFGIRAPGRENRFHEQPLSLMPDFVNACTSAIDAVFPKCRSIRLASFCLSAKTIIMIASVMEAKRPWCEVELVLVEPNLWLPETQVPWLDLTLQEIAEKLRKQSTVPESMLSDLDVLKFFAPMIAADFELSDNYDIPITTAVSADVLIINSVQSGIDSDRLRARCRSISTGEVSVRDVESPASLVSCPTVVADALIGFSCGRTA